MEGLYYLYSENKGADQLRSYCAADLRLCFCICKSRFSHDEAQFFLTYLTRQSICRSSRRSNRGCGRGAGICSISTNGPSSGTRSAVDLETLGLRSVLEAHMDPESRKPTLPIMSQHLMII